MRKRKQTFLIQGLAGQKLLTGAVKVNGAKNAALKAMAAALLFDDIVVLENIPETDDIVTMSAILGKLGAKVTKKAEHTYEIDSRNVRTTSIDPVLASSMRASVVLTGPLLARFARTILPMPGGCVIGARPIDLFIKGYEAMGASTSEKNGLYDISGTPHGAEIFFEKISVGATETLMMAATIAHGKTILKNCAREPEIANVANWLNSCGAKIKGAGTSTIEIDGTGGKLFKATVVYRAIPDRIEAGSYMILGALCAEELVIEDCLPEHLEATTALLHAAGVDIAVEANKIVVSNRDKDQSFKSFDLKTQEFPGFPTDLQAPMVTFLTQASGSSTVVETIFEGRFKYTEDLIELGANIKIQNPREILVTGPTPLVELSSRRVLNAHDIRAGFAVVLAALVGRGEFAIDNIHLIDRGYEKLEERLSALGAKVKRVVETIEG